jgi:hypothetical protein
MSILATLIIFLLGALAGSALTVLYDIAFRRAFEREQRAFDREVREQTGFGPIMKHFNIQDGEALWPSEVNDHIRVISEAERLEKELNDKLMAAEIRRATTEA